MSSSSSDDDEIVNSSVVADLHSLQSDLESDGQRTLSVNAPTLLSSKSSIDTRQSTATSVSGSTASSQGFGVPAYPQVRRRSTLHERQQDPDRTSSMSGESSRAAEPSSHPGTIGMESNDHSISAESAQLQFSPVANRSNPTSMVDYIGKQQTQVPVNTVGTPHASWNDADEVTRESNRSAPATSDLDRSSADPASDILALIVQDTAAEEQLERSQIAASCTEEEAHGLYVDALEVFEGDYREHVNSEEVEARTVLGDEQSAEKKIAELHTSHRIEQETMIAEEAEKRDALEETGQAEDAELVQQHDASLTDAKDRTAKRQLLERQVSALPIVARAMRQNAARCKGKRELSAYLSEMGAAPVTSLVVPQEDSGENDGTPTAGEDAAERKAASADMPEAATVYCGKSSATVPLYQRDGPMNKWIRSATRELIGAASCLQRFARSRVLVRAKTKNMIVQRLRLEGRAESRFVRDVSVPECQSHEQLSRYQMALVEIQQWARVMAEFNSEAEATTDREHSNRLAELAQQEHIGRSQVLFTEQRERLGEFRNSYARWTFALEEQRQRGRLQLSLAGDHRTVLLSARGGILTAWKEVLLTAYANRVVLASASGRQIASVVEGHRRHSTSNQNVRQADYSDEEIDEDYEEEEELSEYSTNSSIRGESDDPYRRAPVVQRAHLDSEDEAPSGASRRKVRLDGTTAALKRESKALYKRAVDSKTQAFVEEQSAAELRHQQFMRGLDALQNYVKYGEGLCDKELKRGNVRALRQKQLHSDQHDHQAEPSPRDPRRPGSGSARSRPGSAPEWRGNSPHSYRTDSPRTPKRPPTARAPVLRNRGASQPQEPQGALAPRAPLSSRPPLTVGQHAVIIRRYQYEVVMQAARKATLRSAVGQGVKGSGPSGRSSTAAIHSDHHHEPDEEVMPAAQNEDPIGLESLCEE